MPLYLTMTCVFPGIFDDLVESDLWEASAAAETQLAEEQAALRFRVMVLCHLDDAYNLARWLMRDGNDAQDVVQEAYLRALKAFGTFRGTDARPWLLTIVRNTCFTWIRKGRLRAAGADPELALADVESTEAAPLTTLIRDFEIEQLRQAIEELPMEFREVIVMKDIHDVSYRDIAAVLNVPIGTVMSRLSRARARLHESLCAQAEESP